MRWFQYSIADFEQTINPANGAFVVMERRSKKKTVCILIPWAQLSVLGHGVRISLLCCMCPVMVVRSLEQTGIFYVGYF